MSYLEKLKCPETKYVSGTSRGDFQPKRQIAKSVLRWLGVFSVIAFFVGGGFAVEYAVSNAAKIHHPYRGVYHIPYSNIEKDLHIQSITISWNDFIDGKFALGDKLSIIPEGEGQRKVLDDPLGFAACNAAKKYLSKTTALDWVLPSRLAGAGKKSTEIVTTENLSMSYSVVPYGDFSGSNGASVQGSSYHMSDPFFETDGMQGLTGFDRLFADGETRRIDLSNDIFVFLRPDVHRIWRRDKTSIELGTPNLEPEESLSVAYCIITNLYDWKKEEWDENRTKELILNQYAAYAGVPLEEPEKLSIVGNKFNARFVYTGKLPVDMTVVAYKKIDKNGRETDGYEEVAVPLRNSRNELLFFGSLDPTQSIIIPFSYLAKMGQDDPIVLGAKRDKSITYRDILVAQQQVEENRRAKVLPLYPGNGNSNFGDSYLAAYVVKTPSTERLAKEIIGDASTKPEALQKISDFAARNLDYISDKKFDGSKSGNSGPEEIPMTLPMAMLNRGEDCEGHAIAMATLYFSAEDTILGDTSTVAIGTLNFFGRGHAITLVQAENIPAERVITDPFPNHVLIDGTPFVFIEATGETESLDTKTKGNVFETDKLHQFSWQEKGYDNPIISVIHGVGTNRTVRMAGVSEFEFEHSSAHSLLSCLK
jgi:hypothetical protein